MQRADSSLQLQGRRADGQTHKVSCRLHVELRSRECVQEEEEEQQEEEQEQEEEKEQEEEQEEKRPKGSILRAHFPRADVLTPSFVSQPAGFRFTRVTSPVLAFSR